MRALLRYFIAGFFHFIVSLINPLKRLSGLLRLNFTSKVTLLYIKRSTRLHRVRTEENIAAVSSSRNDDHQLSIRHSSQQLGLCYSTMWKILRKLDWHDMWFQRDGASCHTARVTIDLLRGQLGEHSGPVNRPPRFRLFLWGHVKTHVNWRIEAFIREIPAKILERIYRNWTKRMGHLRRSCGQHLHKIIFKH